MSGVEAVLAAIVWIGVSTSSPFIGPAISI